MSDGPDDPETPLQPFPTALPVSPFPPLEGEAAPYLEAPVEDDAPAAADPPSDWIAGADAHDLPTAEPNSPINPLLALGRFAFPPGEPPDDEGMAARDRRWTSRTLAIATAFLLIFNVASVQNWARQQPPGWITTTVRSLADVWAEQTAQLGADRPRETLRDAYQAARDSRWAGDAD